MAETGLSLVVSREMLANLQKADNAITNLATKSEQAKNRIVAAFTEMGDKGVGAFIRRLNEAQAKIASFNNIKVQGADFSQFTNNTTQAIDNVNRLTEAISKVQNQRAKGSVNISTQDNLIKTYESQLASLWAKLDETRKKIASLHLEWNKNEASRGGFGEDIKNTTQEANRLMHEIKNVQNLLNVIKGQSEESFGAMFKTMQQSDFELVQLNQSLRDGNSLLQKQTELWQQSYQAKEKSDKSKSNYDEQMRAYERMFDKIIAKENEQVRVATENAKQRTEQAKQGYAAQLRAWEEMFDKIEQKEQKKLSEYKLQNELAKGSMITAPKEYQQTLNMYEQMFTELEKQRAQQLVQEENYNRKLARIAIERNQAEVRSARESYKQRKDMYERLFIEIERQEEKLARQQSKSRRDSYERYISSYEGAMRLSGKANTLSKEERAIKALEQARANLSKTDSQYEQKLRSLNAAIVQHKQNIDKATQGSKNLQNAHSSLMNISEQLTRRLALVFSVSQITGYINKLISVRGEFELQQRALQAILQNREEANKLWEKTVQLAVQSPFQVKELVTYTKQLAAYRVESDKLYDTTKMLADVSAGLGVDMQRLILAYGQVKAANYLRGTELRQFSEAGINILGELATYFTELEGVAVSVGDVFERVSKRMVTFGDVEEVFKRLTSAGGTFYRMQEIQAETLRGQISNLKDSIDIMLNKVGKANEDTLKNTVSLVRRFVESWENIVDILHAAGAAFVIVTTAKLKDALATGVWAKANIAATATQKGLNAVIARGILALRGLWATLMANPITALLAGLAALGVGLYRLVKRSIDANKAFKDNIEQLSAQNREIKKYTDELAILVKRQNELVKSNKELAVTSEEYRENSLEISRIEDKRKSIIESINSLDSTYAQNLKKAGLNIAELTKQTSEYNQELITRLALERDLKKLSGDDFLEDFNNATTELNISASKVEASYKKTITSVNKLLQQPEKLSDNARKALENFNNSTEPFLDRFIKLHQETALNANELWGKLDFSPIGNYITKLFEFNTLFDKVEPELRASANTFKDSQLGVNLFSIIADEDASEEDKNNAKNKIIDYFEDILDDKRVVGKLREKATNLFANIFGFEWRKENIPNPLEEWKVVYNEFITSLDQEGGSRIAPATLETTLEQLRKDVKGEVDRLTKEIVEYENASEELKKARKTQYESDKISLENYKKIREFLGYTPEKTTEGEKDNTWTNLMRVVKEVNTEFKNLNNTFDKTTALQGTLAKYSDALTTAFKGTGKNFTDFDFTTESGLIEFYDWLIKVVPQIDKLKAQLAKGEIVWDVRINQKELEDKALLDQIEEMFSGYEISLELQKLNIPRDLAEQLFNVDTFTLPELKDAIIKLKPEFEGKDMLDEWNKLMKRINDMEVKATRERLKTYTKYLVKAQSERVKIKLEELRQIEEVEKESAYSDTQKEAIKQGIKQETQKKLDKQEWEEFKDSDLYIQMFDELQYASTKSLETMRDKLNLLRDSLKNLDPSELKEIQSRLVEINDELISRNPFEKFGSTIRDGVKALKSLNEQQEKYNQASEKEKSAQDLVDTLQIQVTKAREKNAELKKTGAFNAGTLAIMDNELKVQEEQLAVAIKQYAIAKGITEQEAKKLLEEKQKVAKATKSLQEVGRYGAEIISMVNTVSDTLSNFGVNLGAEFDIALSGASQVFDSLMNIDLQDPLSIAKGAIGAISGVANAIAEVHDVKIERQINRELELLENLGNAYERLEERIDRAFSLSTLHSNTQEAMDNLQSQIYSYERMIKLEKDKKKTDTDAVRQYENAIKDLQDKQRELEKELVSTATSGILDSTRDAARQFVDAWYDAFAETGDGLQGLKDNFKEIMLDMIQQQASMTIAGNFLNRWKAQLDKYINADDLELTTKEASNWMRSVQEELPILNEALQNYFTAMEQAGLDLSKTGEMSGLQRGIQSVTEETAQALEALLNSTRFFVADSNAKLTLLVDSFTNPESANPMLSELRSQTDLIRTIRDMFSSVIGRGDSTHSGAYLKVVM